MQKQYSPQRSVAGGNVGGFSATGNDCSGYCSGRSSIGDGASETCRVCQCAESDKRGDAVLEFLGIFPPFKCNYEAKVKKGEDVAADIIDGAHHFKNNMSESGFVEFISPEGDVFVCKSDIEMGSYGHPDALIELGCSCKNDLALVHYACALKWFINHGSTICEICGSVAKNIQKADVNKVVGSLKNYDALRERTACGEPIPVQGQIASGVDPDAVAAVRRQRLSEIALWFSPFISHDNVNSTIVPVSEVMSEQPLNIVEENSPMENYATKWAVEGTGILLATGLLTVTLAWLIAPRVGKKTAKRGLHILLGGVCALAVVIFFRFVVLRRIRLGPARYWAILFVFWFLVFGIWASWTRGAHKT